MMMIDDDDDAADDDDDAADDDDDCVCCSRTKQYLSDSDFRPEVFLHLPAGVVRDVADMVPEGSLT